MKKLLLVVATLFSSQFLLAQSTTPAPYCDASFDDMNGFPVDDHINSITFGTLTNNSNAQFAAPHYVFYNNINVSSFNAGSSYPVSLNFTVAGGCGYGVWIDYNHNNLFDVDEKVAGTSANSYLNIGNSTNVTSTVNIPLNALNGNTRMRVRIVEDDNFHAANSTNELPCNASNSDTDVMDWGETEDYTINIVSLTTSNLERNNNSEIDLFPNPSTNFLTVKNEANSFLNYQIFSIDGKCIQIGNLNNQSSLIDISLIDSGLYTINLIDKNGNNSTKKFLKE